MLILFDIDGTLVRTYPWEDEYYDAALQTIGLSLPTTDYEALGASTDLSILRVLAQRAWSRQPRPEEIRALRSRHVAAWTEHLAVHRLEPVEGGLEAIATLRSRNLTCAAATGGFRTTAEMKLRAIGLVLPIAAAAEDGTDRPDILKQAASGRAPVTYIGDGTWDAIAARSHGWRFVGVAKTPERRAAFAAMGCEVVEDLRDIAEILV